MLTWEISNIWITDMSVVSQENWAAFALEYVGNSAPRVCTEDEGLAPRNRLGGAGSKTLQAAVVKRHGGER